MGIRITQHKRGWWMVDIRLRLPTGVQIRDRKKAPVSSRSAAERWGQARVNHLLAFGTTPEKKEVPTLAQFEARFIDGYAIANRQKHSGIVSKRSIFKHHLVPQLGAKRLDEISTADVQALKADLAARGKAPKTVNCVLTVLKKLLDVAVDWEVISAAAAKIELVKLDEQEMRFYDQEQFEALLMASRKVDPRAELVVLLGGDAGLRKGEIVAVEQQDVDRKRGILTVRHGEWRGVVSSTKGNRARPIPMTERLAAALAASRHLRGDRVLYRDDGRTVSPKMLYMWMCSAQRLAGLEVTGGVHVLRHSFAARLAMHGAPAKAIQELMGHRNLSTTMRYMHLSPAAKDSAIRLLNMGNTRATVEEKKRTP